MRPVFVLLILVYFARDSHETVQDFLGGIGHAFSVAWASVVDAVKKPVRTKKVGPISRRRVANVITISTPHVWSSPTDSEKFVNDMSNKSDADIKVTLPLLLHPKYKLLSAWMRSVTPQRSTTKQWNSTSTLIFNPKKLSSEASEDSEDSTDDRENDDSSMLGPLVFI